MGSPQDYISNGVDTDSRLRRIEVNSDLWGRIYPVRTPPTLSAVTIEVADGNVMLPSADREALVLTGFT